VVRALADLQVSATEFDLDFGYDFLYIGPPATGPTVAGAMARTCDGSCSTNGWVWTCAPNCYTGQSPPNLGIVPQNVAMSAGDIIDWRAHTWRKDYMYGNLHTYTGQTNRKSKDKERAGACSAPGSAAQGAGVITRITHDSHTITHLYAGASAITPISKQRIPNAPNAKKLKRASRFALSAERI
jgi:hypothetical protein